MPPRLALNPEYEPEAPLPPPPPARDRWAQDHYAVNTPIPVVRTLPAAAPPAAPAPEGA